MTEREAERRYLDGFLANDYADDWHKYLRERGVSIDPPEDKKEDDYRAPPPEPEPPKPEPPRRIDMMAAARHHDAVNRCRDINARRAEARREENRRNRLAPEVRIARYRDGKKVSDIAEQFQMSRSYVLWFAPLNTREAKIAKRMRGEGKTDQEIGEKLKYGENSVKLFFQAVETA